MFKPSINVHIKSEWVNLEPKKFLLEIIPHPAFTMAKKTQIEISEAEYTAICDWQDGNLLIQEALPLWPQEKRELLLTGLDSATWNAIMGDGNDEEDDD